MEETLVEPRAMSDDKAVSSVIGTVLMLGITLVVFAGVSIVVLAYFQGQPHAPRTELAVQKDTTSGAGSFLFTNKGGEAIPTGATLQVNKGGTVYSYTLADSHFSAIGPTWEVGETLCVQGTGATCLYLPTDDVRGAQIIFAGLLLIGDMPSGATTATSTSSSSSTTTSGCMPDVTAPTVSSVTASPSDLTVSSTGSVVVTVVAADACSGVNDAIAPHLKWDIQASVTSPTTDVGAMTLTGSHTWQDTIPAQNWAANLNKYLVYQVTGIKDVSGNTGNSAVKSDKIDPTLNDPGQAFVDGNNNFQYDSGETLIATSAITSSSTTTGTGYSCNLGCTTTGSNGLVIPPSVGSLTASSLSFVAGGELTVAVSMTSTTSALTLQSKNLQPLTIVGTPTFTTQGSDKDIVLTSAGAMTAGSGVTMAASGTITITTQSTTDLTGVKLTAGGSTNLVKVDASATGNGGFVTMTNAQVSSPTTVTVQGVGVAMAGAKVATGGSNRDLTLDAGSGPLTLTGPGAACTSSTCISSSGQVILKGSAIALDGNTFAAGGSNKVTATATSTLTAVGANLQAGGAISLTGVGLDASNAKMASGNGQDITLDAGSGALTATGPGSLCSTPYCLNSPGAIVLSGASVTLNGNTFTTTGSSTTGNQIKITAATTGLSATSAKFQSGGNLLLTAATTLTLTNTQLTTSGTGDLTLTGPTAIAGTGATVASGGATILTGGAVTFTGTLTAGQTFTATGSSMTFDGATISTGGSGYALQVGPTCTNTPTGTLSAKNAKVVSSSSLCLNAATVNVDGACLTTQGSANALKVTGGSGGISANGPSTRSGCTGYSSSGTIVFSGTGPITATSAAFATGGSNQDIVVGPGSACGGSSSTTITTTGSTLAATGQVCIRGATLVLDSGTYTTGGSNAMTFTASGSLSAKNAKAIGTSSVDVTGVGVTLDGACMTSQNSQDITIAAGSGALSAKGPSTPSGCTGFLASKRFVVTGGSITLDSATFQSLGTSKDDDTFTASAGGISLKSATLKAPVSPTTNNLISTVPTSGGFKVDVAGATFVDANNKLKVNPNNSATYVTGLPASGGTE